ncbi:MAG: hypothetical protein M5U34_16710 [Chloroflexi bacterium]|nr:hypothetical protein [Chloroflexota bacterium]
MPRDRRQVMLGRAAAAMVSRRYPLAAITFTDHIMAVLPDDKTRRQPNPARLCRRPATFPCSSFHQVSPYLDQLIIDGCLAKARTPASNYSKLVKNSGAWWVQASRRKPCRPAAHSAQTVGFHF